MCSRIRNWLPEYSVGALAGRRLREVEAHLAACETCRRELRALEATAALVERHGFRNPPPGLFQGVRHRIEAGEGTRERAPWWWPILSSRPARVAAMGLAVASVALGLLIPVGTAPVPRPGDLHHRAGAGALAVRGPIGESIRQHALSAGEGPLADRVAWEAMAQLVAQEREKTARPAPKHRTE